MRYVIREYSPADAHRVAELWHGLSEMYAKLRPVYYGLKQNSLELLVPYVKDCANRGAILYVAEAEERVCGFVIGYVIFRLPHLSLERIGRIDNLYVEEEYRGGGIGSALIEKMCDFYEGVGVEVVEISTDMMNQKAKSLYEKLGFVAGKITLMK